MLPNALTFARSLLEGRLKAGGRALDGTAGNGHDTLLLARLVGETGRVWAFDIQKQALDATEGRLKAAGADKQVVLVCDSHERLADYIKEPLDAAVFNFGYLPGGDKNITTRAESSIAALEAALGLLTEGGILAAVQEWAAALPQERLAVLRYAFANQRNCPPLLLAVEKIPNKPSKGTLP